MVLLMVGIPQVVRSGPPGGAPVCSSRFRPGAAVPARPAETRFSAAPCFCAACAMRRRFCKNWPACAKACSSQAFCARSSARPPARNACASKLPRRCRDGQRASKAMLQRAADKQAWKKTGSRRQAKSRTILQRPQRRPALPAKSKRPPSACRPGRFSAGAACATPRQRGKRGEWACRSINQTRPAYCLMWTDCFKSGLN